MQEVTKVNFSYSPIQTPYSVGDLILGGSYKIVDISNGEILAVNDKGETIIYSSETGECLSHPKRSLPGLSKYPRNLFMEFKYGVERFDSKEDEFKLVRGILREASLLYPLGLVKILITTNYGEDKLYNRLFIGRKPYLRTPGGYIDLCLYNEGHYFYEYWSSSAESDSTAVRECSKHYCNTSLTASVSKHEVCYIGYCSSRCEYSFSIEQPTEEEIKDFLDNEWKN